MIEFNKIKTAAEIKRFAKRATSQTLPVEAAGTLPVPKRIDNKYQIQILFYRVRNRNGEAVFSGPDHCMLLDPETGRVARFWACVPEEIGIGPKAFSISGAGIRDDITMDEFLAKKERLLEISKPVWIAFFSGKTPNDPETHALAREYLRLFLETSPTQVAAFITATAEDFFRWLESVAK